MITSTNPENPLPRAVPPAQLAGGDGGRTAIGALRRHVAAIGIFMPLIGLGIAYAIAAPGFLTGGNLINILEQSASVAILAAGLTLVIVASEIDLSIASIQAAASALAAWLMVASGVNVVLAIACALLIGLVIGAINGLITYVIRIPSFIVTLAVLGIAQGIALIITGGRTIAGLPDSFTRIASGELGPLPVSVIIAAAVYVVLWLAMTKTSFGLGIYAIGGGREAAKANGIRVGGTTIAVFAASGLLAALAGIVLSARVEAANPGFGSRDLVDAVAAVVVGGVSLFGGVGSVLGTLGGVLVIATLRNGLVLLGVQPYWQEIAVGSMIVAAVALSELLQGRARWTFIERLIAYRRRQLLHRHATSRQRERV